MLLALLYQLFIFVFCSMAGFFFYAILKGFAFARSRSFLLHFITGLLASTLVSQAIVLWFPINFSTTIFYTGLLIATSILYRKETGILIKNRISQFKNIEFTEGLVLSLFTVLVLIYNAGPTNMDDTESYHIQMIKWINEYGTVPGIAVLHERFGFNSSWFIAIAQFIPTGNAIKLYGILNGSLSLVLGYYLITEFKRSVVLKEKSFALSLLAIFALCLFSWPILRGNAGNSNYDLIAAVLVFILLVESLKNKGDVRTLLSIEWILWPVFLFTVRIINYPFLLLPLIMLIWIIRMGKLKSILPTVLICVFAVIPFLARNVYVSGYVFYPLMSIDLFHVDWKPDPAIVQERIDFTKYFNRVNTMYMDIDSTKKLAFPSWLPYWFYYLFGYDKPWVIAGLLGIIQSLVLFKKNIARLGRETWVITIILLIQVISWMIISPDPRFIYGTLISGSFLFLYALFDFIKRFQIINWRLIFIGTSIVLMGYSASLFIRKEALRNPIIPASIAKPGVNTFEIDGVMFHLPEKVKGNWNTRCYDAPLPCLYIMDPRIHLRGKSIKEGFKIE